MTLKVKTVPLDLNAGVTDDHTAAYQRVLLDAPCSGLGVLRRNPDAKWSIRERDLITHAKRQVRFLNAVSDTVAKGGALVYAVCSTEPEETESVVSRFLQGRRDFSVDKATGSLPDKACRTLTPAGYLLTLPHLHGMDGFFAARLRRSI